MGRAGRWPHSRRLASAPCSPHDREARAGPSAPPPDPPPEGSSLAAPVARIMALIERGQALRAAAAVPSVDEAAKVRRRPPSLSLPLSMLLMQVA